MGGGGCLRKNPLHGGGMNMPNDNMIQTWFAKPLICRVTTFALLFKFPRKNDCVVPLFIK